MIEKSKCIGCLSCVNICPEKCINMVGDELGFTYPVIDLSKCVECNLCVKVCPCTESLQKRNDYKTKAFAVANKDDEIRKKSSSGGVFRSLAEEVIHRNGIVYGVTFDDEMYSVSHIGIERVEELHKLQGSKYLQSHLGNVFENIEKQLKHGKLVLFSGTPCQIAALKKYINTEYDNLYLVDIVCHGVPSQEVWKRYLKNLENENGSKAVSASFRDKNAGWKNFYVRVEFENGNQILEPYNKNLYFRGFLKNIFLRSSCYNCMYKSVDRISDITMADFWGVDVILPDINDDRGLSLVLTNSEKGEQMIGSIQDNCLIREVELNEAIKYNSAAITSVEEPLCRDKFMKELNYISIDKLLRKYCGESVKEKTKKIIKRLIRY